MSDKQELPNGWELVKLKDLAQIETGNTPAKNNPSFYGGTVPFILQELVPYCTLYSPQNGMLHGSHWIALLQPTALMLDE